jgi:hypothetical protein
MDWIMEMGRIGVLVGRLALENKKIAGERKSLAP